MWSPKTALPTRPVTAAAARYAELLSDQRSFSAEELALFERSARSSYEDFRNKAALSRRMAEEDLEDKAQVLLLRRPVPDGLARSVS